MNMNTDEMPIPTDTDEMPAPPTAAAASTEAEPIPTEFNADVVAEAYGRGEAFPAGTFHFRLDGYSEGWGNEGSDEKNKLSHLGNQPYFMLQWVCQQEPYVGKRYLQFLGWVNAETMKLAEKKDSQALGFAKERLGDVKTLMIGCNYKPHGRSDLKTFLESHPEAKISLTIRERKIKINGVLTPTGEMVNNVQKISPVYSRG